jgi:hypothetical protein
MHPLFESWAAARAEGDFIEARLIGRQIQNATKLSWVLHDEIGISDLMTKHDKQKVDLVNEFVEGVETSVTPSKGETLPKFEELTLPKKLAEFKKWLRQRAHRSLDTSPPLTFEEMLQIYEIDYSAQDLMVVDPGAEPFGINNTPDSPYLMIKGRAYYAKLRDWWEHVRYKLTVTTTERKILRSLDHIRAKQLQAIEKDPQYGPQLRTWRADTANLGPDDWVPQKPEVPQKFLPIWCVNEYPLTGYLPPDHLRVQIYLDDRARVPRKNDPKRTSVTTIYEEIKAADPNAIVISNCLPDTDAITPAKAKGANDYIGKRIYYVMLHPAQDKYRDLLIENAVFAARNFVQLEFVDEFDQIVGRTLGFRYRPPGSTVNGTIVTGSEAIVITSPKLWKQVAGPLCRYSKYEIMAPRQVNRGGKLP